MVTQTTTPSSTLFPLPSKDELCSQFVEKPLEALRTPAIVIERKPYAKNCQAMADRCSKAGAHFRGHVKSHKTVEGTRLQLQTTPPCKSVVCSTFPELWGLVDGDLGKDGTVESVLYGFPLPMDKISDLAELQQHFKQVLIMIDDVRQVAGLAAYNAQEGTQVQFSCFVKLDQGNARAGLTVESAQLKELIESIISSPYLTIYGFYTHSGNAYASRTHPSAHSFLTTEITTVNAAASLARTIYTSKNLPVPSFVLSVGSTPTAHVAGEAGKDGLEGELEVHAGVYPLCDLQQQSTSLAKEENLAMGVLSRVCAVYEHRTVPQVLIDAGAIAFSKDQGPTGDYGRVYWSSFDQLKGWKVAKTSQEHGLLEPPQDMDVEEARKVLTQLSLGELVKIRPQHACLTCAAHHWYYVTEEAQDTIVKDVWVPWKGW